MSLERMVRLNNGSTITFEIDEFISNLEKKYFSPHIRKLEKIINHSVFIDVLRHLKNRDIQFHFEFEEDNLYLKHLKSSKILRRSVEKLYDNKIYKKSIFTDSIQFLYQELIKSKYLESELYNPVYRMLSDIAEKNVNEYLTKFYIEKPKQNSPKIFFLDDLSYMVDRKNSIEEGSYFGNNIVKIKVNQFSKSKKIIPTIIHEILHQKSYESSTRIGTDDSSLNFPGEEINEGVTIYLTEKICKKHYKHFSHKEPYYRRQLNMIKKSNIPIEVFLDAYFNEEGLNRLIQYPEIYSKNKIIQRIINKQWE